MSVYTTQAEKWCPSRRRRKKKEKNIITIIIRKPCKRRQEINPSSEAPFTNTPCTMCCMWCVLLSMSALVLLHCHCLFALWLLYAHAHAVGLMLLLLLLLLFASSITFDSNTRANFYNDWTSLSSQYAKDIQSEHTFRSKRTQYGFTLVFTLCPD